MKRNLKKSNKETTMLLAEGIECVGLDNRYGYRFALPCTRSHTEQITGTRVAPRRARPDAH